MERIVLDRIATVHHHIHAGRIYREHRHRQDIRIELSHIGAEARPRRNEATDGTAAIRIGHINERIARNRLLNVVHKPFQRRVLAPVLAFDNINGRIELT